MTEQVTTWHCPFCGVRLCNETGGPKGGQCPGCSARQPKHISEVINQAGLPWVEDE